MNYQILINKEHIINNKYFEGLLLKVAYDCAGKELLMEHVTYEQFQLLKSDLYERGIVIGLSYGYRTRQEQAKIYNNFIELYGEVYANKVVAPVGTSEHHTGLALDIDIKTDGTYSMNNQECMEKEPIFQEIYKHLDKYGFILRYPKGKEDITGYPYEPWHIRYVGIDAAKEIKKKAITLEEYCLKH